MHQPTRRLVLPLVALAAASVLAAGCGSKNTSDAVAKPAKPAAAADATAAATDTTAVTTLKVTAGEMYFKPTSYTAKAGKVNFQFTNAGTVEHELIVLKTDKPASSYKPGADGRISEDDSVGEVSETKAGATASKVLDLKPGKYVLVCNIPGHFAAGMQATLVVS